MQLRPGTAQEAGFSAKRIAQVKELAAGWVSQGVTQASVIVVARRGIVVLHEAFGRLTPEPDALALPLNAVFPLASLTKPVTATAAMLLVEEGRLGLNRPVVEYIPEFVGGGKASVMVHHLLTHTSGLLDSAVDVYVDRKSQIGVQIPPAEATQHPRLHEYLFLGYDTPLWKSPGIEMSYTSFNYDLLGEIVRRISGQSLADFASERIFEPLGMRDSWYSPPTPVGERIVKRPSNSLGAELADLPPYIKDLIGGLNSRAWQEIPLGGSGAYSTAMDMARFAQMFLNRGRYGEAQILSPATVTAMTRNQIPGIGSFGENQIFPEASWGLGWDVQGEKKSREGGTLSSPATFSHGGLGGVYLWVDPVSEIVGVYFSVWLRMTADGKFAEWPVDLFMNAVTAAVSEG